MSEVDPLTAQELARKARKRTASRVALMVALDDAAHAVEVISIKELIDLSPLLGQRLQRHDIEEWPCWLREVAERLEAANGEDQQFLEQIAAMGKGE